MSGPRIRAKSAPKFSLDKYYNPKLKSAFIKQYRNGKTDGCQWNSIFLRTQIIEEKTNKDCCNFTHEEIDALLYDFKSSSALTLGVKLSILRSYTEYCIKNGWSIDNINHYVEFPRSTFEKYIATKKADLYFFTENELKEKVLNKLLCDRDRFIVLSMYYGISGEKFEDIIELRTSDLKGNNKLYIRSTGETKTVPAVLYNVIEKAIDEEGFAAPNGKVWKLESSDDRVLKTTSTGIARVHITEGVIRKRFEKMREATNLPVFSFKIILKSGFYNQIMKLSSETGMDVAHIIASEEGQKLRELYSMPKTDVQIIMGYKDFIDHVKRIEEKK